GDGAHDLRHVCEHFIEYRSLVVFVIRRSFNLHRVSFRLTFSANNLGFGQTTGADDFGLSQTTGAGGFRFALALCFGAIGQTLSFQDDALALGFRHGFDAAALSFGGFLDGCLQLQFTALDFGLLHFDLGVLLNLGHADGFLDYLLLRHIGLDIVGFVGGCLLFLYLGFEFSFFEGQVALRFGLEGQRFGLGLHALLIRFGAGNGGFTGCISLLDLGVALCQGRGNIGLLANFGDLGTAHVGDVIVLVAYVLDSEGDDFQSHLGHIGSDGSEHLATDALRIFDQVFNGQLANNATQMAFHHQTDQILTVGLRFAQKLLGGGLDALFV